MASPYLPWWLPLSVLTWAVQMLVFHGVGLFFQWCDRTGRLARFKVRAFDAVTYHQLLPRVLFNQVFILLPAMLAVEWAGLAFVGQPHLSVWFFIAAFVLMTIGHDVVFYVFHRFVLHRPTLMRTLGHDVHHSINASRGISACYMSPADFFLEIVCPYLVPLVLIGGGGADITFHLLLAGVGAVGGLYEHSGYDFAAPLRARLAAGAGGLSTRLGAAMVSSHAHGEHHRRGNVSFSDGFGSPSICDTALKTRWDMVPERTRNSRRERPAEETATPLPNAPSR